MKRWLGFAIVLLLVAALVMGERRKAEAPVSPDPVIYFIADTEREVSRVVATATRLSDEEEIRIGDELAARYAGGSTPLTGDDAAVEAYVQKVGLQVGARAHRQLPYKFHYIPDRGFVNAFALPGGHIFIGTGMIALMDSEDQLAGVLGHEVEHVDHYHCAERVQLEARLRQLNLGVVGALISIPVEVFQAGYTKDQELEADSEGTRLAAKAGYAPGARCGSSRSSPSWSGRLPIRLARPRKRLLGPRCKPSRDTSARIRPPRSASRVSAAGSRPSCGTGVQNARCRWRSTSKPQPRLSPAPRRSS